MKSALVVSMLALVGGTATASEIQPPAVHNVLHSGIMLQVDGGTAGGADALLRVYDEWSATAQGGTSVFNGLFNTGGTEIADDLNMLANGVQWLDSLGFAVGNATGPAGSVGFTAGGQVQIAFYRQSNGSVITSVGGFTSFTANLPALNQAPGASSRLSFPVGALKSLGWYFDTDNIHASLKVLVAPGTGGFTIDHVGHQLRDGNAVGTSTDSLYSFGPTPPAGFFNFGGNPKADSAWFIHTDSVPAPGTLALIGLGGLLAARRRR